MYDWTVKRPPLCSSAPQGSQTYKRWLHLRSRSIFWRNAWDCVTFWSISACMRLKGLARQRLGSNLRWLRYRIGEFAVQSKIKV